MKLPKPLSFLRYLVLVAMVALPGCKNDARKEPRTPALEPNSRESFPELTQELKKIAQENAANSRGFILYLRLDSGYEWLEAVGTRSVGGEKTTGDERFEIGSITKLFTAISILQLSETGALKLTAPLTEFFNEDLLSVLVGGEMGDVSDLKVRHLLNHSTGIGDYINIGPDPEIFKKYGIKGDQVYSPPDLLELARDYTESPSLLPEKHYPFPWRTLAGEGIKSYDAMPGAFYSNTGYIMLGMIIKQVSNLKYEDYVSQHILSPLSLTDTGFPTRAIRTDFTGYATGITDEAAHTSPSFMWSAGAAVSTVSDLSIFLEAAFNGELFKHQSTLRNWTGEKFIPLLGLDFLPKYGQGLMVQKLKISKSSVMMDKPSGAPRLRDDATNLAR